MNTTITNNQEQSFVEAPTPSVDGENPQVSAQDSLAQQEEKNDEAFAKRLHLPVWQRNDRSDPLPWEPGIF